MIRSHDGGENGLQGGDVRDTLSVEALEGLAEQRADCLPNRNFEKVAGLSIYANDRLFLYLFTNVVQLHSMHRVCSHS